MRSDNVLIIINDRYCNACLAGLPALSTTCGFDTGELPVDLQIVGRAMDESTVLSVGHIYESSTSWDSEKPPTFMPTFF